MIYKFSATTQFKRDLKRMKKRGADLDKMYAVIDHLLNGDLPARYRDHALVGDYIGFRECHIEPDWLLVYTIDGDELILTAIATGSHSDLFN